MATIKIGAINTDATNRDRKVNDTVKLAENIARRLRARKPTVLTLSEVFSVKLHKYIVDEVDYKYHSVCKEFTSADRIVQLRDADTYERNGRPVISQTGKYMGVSLRHKELKQDHLHVSVHLPYKRGKQQAFESLQRYLEEKGGDYEYVHIHGDFNESYDNLMEQFKDLDLRFAFDAVTTRAGGKRDNVVSLGEVNFRNQFVQSNSVFTHHPIYVTSQLED